MKQTLDHTALHQSSLTVLFDHIYLYQQAFNKGFPRFRNVNAVLTKGLLELN